MVVFTFSMLDKDDKERYFKNSFLLAKIQVGIIFKILFLTLSNANIDFQPQELQ